MEEKTGAVKNPSYDTSLPIKTRLRDFLGKYHILLNGVVKHDPFDLKYEGKPGVRCDEDHKQEIIEFVEKALSQSKKDVIELVENKKKNIPAYPMEGEKAEEITWAAKTGYTNALDDILLSLRDKEDK